MDGRGNNQTNPDWGSAGTTFLRADTTVHYGDGVATPAGVNRPSARSVSNAIGSQLGSTPDAACRSDYVWQWGQFLDHDITLTPTGATEFFPVIVTDPTDPLFPMVPMMRSAFSPSTGTGANNPREQVNVNTAYIDASMVYGSDLGRAGALRENVGGLLKTTTGGELMMRNTGLLPNGNDGPEPDATLFIGGDIRVNEQPGLIAMHTLFVREHNRLVSELAVQHPDWDGDQLYHHGRRMVGGMVQAITYNEYLPALLGNAAPSLVGAQYDPLINAGIMNEFATAAFRLGHTQVSDHLLRLDSAGNPMPGGPIALMDGFFRPSLITGPDEIDGLLHGLAKQIQQETDVMIIDALRNNLFGPSGGGGLDLMSLNLQRGRDHGLPTLVEIQSVLGLTPASSFAAISSDASVQAALASVYDSVEDVDLWIGLLAEDDLENAVVGPTMATIISQQFYNLMVGDRFFMLWDDEMSDADINYVMHSTLSEIIMRNTSIDNLQANAFFVPEPAWSASLLAIALVSLLTRRQQIAP